MNVDNPHHDEQRKAAALEALAAQEDLDKAPPASGDDPFSRLQEAADAEPELIVVEEQGSDGAQDFLNQMAQESNAVSPELNQLRSQVGTGLSLADDPLVTPQAISPAAAVAPARTPSKRAAILKANAARVHRNSFKQSMIPLLLVVGAMLIIMSVVTMLLLVGDDSDEFGYLEQYGKLFIIVSLPVGGFLIMGAWMFFLDVRKNTPRK